MLILVAAEAWKNIELSAFLALPKAQEDRLAAAFLAHVCGLKSFEWLVIVNWC